MYYRLLLSKYGLLCYRLNKWLMKKNKTLVESFKLGRTLELCMSLSLGKSWKYSTPCLIGLREVKSFINHLILVRLAYIPNFRPLVLSLHVKKFVVGVKTWILVLLRFRPKLNNIYTYHMLCRKVLIDWKENKLGLSCAKLSTA